MSTWLEAAPLQMRSTVSTPFTLRPAALSVICGGVAVAIGVGVGVGVGLGLGFPQLLTVSTVVEAVPSRPPPATKPRVLYTAVADPPTCGATSDGPARQLLVPGL